MIYSIPNNQIFFKHTRIYADLVILPAKSHQHWWRRNSGQEGQRSNSHLSRRFGVQKCCWISEQKWSVGQCALQTQSNPVRPHLGMEGSDSTWKQSHSVHPSEAYWTHSSVESSDHQTTIQESHRPCSSQLTHTHSQHNCNK